MVKFWERLSCILPPLASLELLAAEYLRETNTSNCIYHLLMVTCSLDALKKSWTRKGMKGDRKVKDRDDEILGFDFVFGG